MGDSRPYIAEAIGTFALVFFGTMSVSTAAVVLGFSSATAGVVLIALTHGLILAIMVYSIGAISGCHINPAVTIAMMALKKISVNVGVGYIAAQLLGAAIAGAIHRLILPQGAKVSYGATLPGQAIGESAAIAFVVEAILTFFLLHSIFATAVSDKAPSGWFGFVIGMTLAVSILIAGPLTGASLNPARSFGPAIASGNFTAHWAYWAGPIVGGLLGAYVGNTLYVSDAKSTKK